jgi:hypothetical protein
MASILMILSAIVGLGSLVCWVMVLIKMFGDKEAGGVGKGIFGIICGLYALIWGWQNAAKHNLKTIMLIWTVLVVISIAINVATRAMA